MLSRECMLAYISGDFSAGGELIPLLRLCRVWPTGLRRYFSRVRVIESVKQKAKYLHKIRRRENSYPSGEFSPNAQTHVGQPLFLYGLSLCIRYIIECTLVCTYCIWLPSFLAIFMQREIFLYLQKLTKYTNSIKHRQIFSEKGPPPRLHSSSRAECVRGTSAEGFAGISGFPPGFPLVSEFSLWGAGGLPVIFYGACEIQNHVSS